MSKASTAAIAGMGCIMPLVAGVGLVGAVGVGILGTATQTDQAAMCSESSLSVSIDGDVPTVEGYGKDKMENAAAIMETGKKKGIPARGQLIAIMTAMQETGLENMDSGDRDSLGLFQQRPSQGWGTEKQLTDPTYAAAAFYLGVDSDDGHIPGLSDIKGWQDMQPTVAAQRVQRSAFPEAYAKHEKTARAIISALSGTDVSVDESEAGAANCDEDGKGDASSGPGDAGKLLDVAKSTLGSSYVMGAGGWDGPNGSQDCSGLTTYAYQKAAGIHLPRTARGQWAALKSNEVKASEAKPGDLIFESWGRLGPDTVSHVAIYMGNGKMIEASRSAGKTRISPARLSGDQLAGIARVPSNYGK